MYLYLIFHINKLMLWMNNCNSEISKDIFFMFFPQCENPNYGKSVCFLIFFFKKKSYFSSNRLNVFCSFYCCQTFWLSCSGVLNSIIICIWVFLANATLDFGLIGEVNAPCGCGKVILITGTVSPSTQPLICSM